MLKICGITEEYFASRAAEGGVDYLGFIFASGSPRGITPARAAEIVSAVRRGRPIPRMVGVFTLRPVADVLRVADEVGFDVVQLHGRFSAEDVAAVKASGREVWLLDDGGDVRRHVAPVQLHHIEAHLVRNAQDVRHGTRREYAHHVRGGSVPDGGDDFRRLRGLDAAL